MGRAHFITVAMAAFLGLVSATLGDQPIHIEQLPLGCDEDYFTVFHVEGPPVADAAWQIEVVDAGGLYGDYVGEYCSMGVPMAGPHAKKPGIAYYNRTRTYLKLAQRISGWATCSPDPDPVNDVGPAASLAFAPDTGWATISYQDRTNLDLRVAYFDGASWNVFVAWPYLVGPPYTGECTSLKFLPSGGYGVAFRGVCPYGSAGLVYLDPYGVARCVDTETKAGYYCCLAVGADGRLGIAYSGYASRLKYAWSDDGGQTWSTEVVHNTEGAGCWPSLVFLPSADPAIACYSAKEGLQFACRMGPSSWSWITVDDGRYPSLAIRNGQPVVSYVTDEGLMYAWHTGSDLSTGWHHYDHPLDSGVFAYTSLAILPGERPAIAYHDEANGWLKCAIWTLLHQDTD